MKNKQQALNGLLILLIILENLFLYYFFRNGILTQGYNAIGLFLTSIFFGLVVIYKFYNSDIEVPATIPAKNKPTAYALILLVITAFIFFGIQNAAFYRAHILDHSTSDIIPLIQVMCRRLLSGQYPCSPVNDFGFTQEANYLPMHWMPYTIAELFHIDYRWITFSMWCIAALWLCIRSIEVSDQIIRAIIPIMILASYYVLFHNNSGIVEATVELMVSAYYMTLIMSFNQQNGILQGIIISFCLLSRYSLVLWIPLYCFILFVSHNRKQLYISAITAITIITVLYVIPFLSKDWLLFYRGYKYYDGAAYFEWTHLNEQGKPMQLFSGTGFAYYFYTRFLNIDIPARIKLLQRTHLICSLAVTVVMGTWFWFRKEKINYKIFLSASLKIYLTVFLFLIQVPYGYLMCLGNFVSIAIFCEQARYRLISKQAV